MATYDYYCDVCDINFEIKKPIKDGDKEELCPNCRQVLRKIFHPNPIKFKGNGWTSKLGQ